MTSALRRVGGDYLAATVADVSRLLDDVSGAPLWSNSDTEVTDLVGAVTRVANQVAALQLRVVAEADGRGVAGRVGASSSQAWLRDTIRVSPSEAKQQVVLAAALATGHERVRGALTGGSVTVAQARVIVEAVAELPAEVGADTRDAAEAFLVAQAGVFDPTALARLGRRILDVVDPDAADVDEARRLATQERRAYQRRCLSFTPDGHGTVWLRGRLDTESAAVVRRALDPLAAPRPGGPEQPDTRSPGARTADALVEVCRRAVLAGELPVQRGQRPRVVVTVDADRLRRGVGSGALDTGEDLSPEVVRRLACDAEVTPAVVRRPADGSGSLPLDLGRTVRLFTTAQRRALILRDKGCAFPGCDRPPHWCDAHHVRHWIDGGATDLDNGVLLCGHHHRLIHKGQWHVRIATDGHPEFTPPRTVDPRQLPRRNSVRYPRRE